MKTQLGAFSLGALMLALGGADAAHVSGDQTNARHLSGISGYAAGRDGAYKYLYLNADVNRHYNNEVVFAGRYLGADPDPRIRLTLRRDRPENH